MNKFYGYPFRYHQRGKISDIKFIFQRMSVIPENKKLEVCDEYDRLYHQEGRRAANVFLHETAIKYKNGLHSKNK